MTNINITGPDNAANVLTVDFSGGDPIPAGGVTFDGGAGGGNSLVIKGGAGGNSVTMTATQINDNGSPPITYANVQSFAFALGGGTNSLLIDHATLTLNQDNAISAGTNVTVSGGLLDFNGHADAIGNLTIATGGQVMGTAIANANSTTDVASGTLTAGSIASDTLVIGAPSPGASTVSTNVAAASAAAASGSTGAATLGSVVTQVASPMVANDVSVHPNVESSAIPATPVASQAIGGQMFAGTEGATLPVAVSVVSVAAVAGAPPMASAASPLAGQTTLRRRVSRLPFCRQG